MKLACEANAEKYKKILKPQLMRENNVGGWTHNPKAMVMTRNLIGQDPLYATEVLAPCSWHAIYLVAPVEVKNMQAAITDAKQVTMFLYIDTHP